MRVGVVILGAAGYIAGDTALPCLGRVKERLAREHSVDLQLVAAADPVLFGVGAKTEADWKKTRSARGKLEQFQRDLGYCHLEEDCANIIQIFANTEYWSSRRFPSNVLVYDGTNAPLHGRNLLNILQSERDTVYYFGEKPIFYDPIMLRDVNPRDFDGKVYCDFIETQNPATLKIKQYIYQNSLKIESMKFWRTGASGLKHIVGHQQKGVQGGAFLDKVPHDLSISTFLLGSESIVGFDINAAHIDYLICDRRDGELKLLDARNNWSSTPHFDFRSRDNGDRSRLLADGQTQASISWKLSDGSQVVSSYLCGWLGVGNSDNERSFIDELRRLGFSDRQWLMTTEFDGTSGKRIKEQQARIGIMSLRAENGNRYQLVTNLIAFQDRSWRRFVPQFDRSISRWIKVFDDRGSEVYTWTGESGDYHDQKLEDMANVFTAVVRDIFGIKSCPELSNHAVYWVHKAMLNCRDNAIAEISAGVTGIESILSLSEERIYQALKDQLL